MQRLLRTQFSKRTNYNLFMKRNSSNFLHEEQQPEKKMKTESATTTTTTMTSSNLQDCTKYNHWRVHSLHNPVFKLPTHQQVQFSRLALDKDKYAFRKMLKLDTFAVSLSEKEQQIFSFLLDVNTHFKLNTVMRVAGGWVRNKVLSIDAEDIDIALDNMMGYDFALKVHELQQQRGMALHGIGLIRANPEQSKHLESATTHIYEEAIDFVNLRSEKYAEDSRIPSHMVNKNIFNFDRHLVHHWKMHNVEIWLWIPCITIWIRVKWKILLVWVWAIWNRALYEHHWTLIKHLLMTPCVYCVAFDLLRVTILLLRIAFLKQHWIPKSRYLYHVLFNMLFRKHLQKRWHENVLVLNFPKC